METLVNQVQKNAADIQSRLSVITSANLFEHPRTDVVVLPTAKVSFVIIKFSFPYWVLLPKR